MSEREQAIFTIIAIIGAIVTFIIIKYHSAKMNSLDDTMEYWKDCVQERLNKSLDELAAREADLSSHDNSPPTVKPKARNDRRECISRKLRRM